MSDAPLNTPAPNLNVDQVRALVEDVYAFSCAASPLTSERDQNLLLQVDSGGCCLLKISNPSEPREVVALQTEALDHIARMAPDVPVPRTIPTFDGTSCAEVELPDGRRSLVRLLTYLRGTPAWKTMRTAAQRRSMGRSLAHVDRALEGFSHPAATHDLLWNVSGAHRLAHMISNIAAERRPLIDHFMSRFHRNVQPKLDQLRTQVIHNDFNLYNILVDETDDTQVSGIIDFGDIMFAPLVGEVATGAAYQMSGEVDPLAAAAEFVAAYHEVLPLTPKELELIPDLMATRHLITVLITEWRSVRYPENRDYILRHNPMAWDCLIQLADIPLQQQHDRLQHSLS